MSSFFHTSAFLFSFLFCSFFFFNDTATTEIYTLSLHDALPISGDRRPRPAGCHPERLLDHRRSEEHTSELQSPDHLVCRLLLEKKKKTLKYRPPFTYKSNYIYNPKNIQYH